MESELVKKNLKELRVMFLCRCGPDPGHCGNRVSGSVVFSLQTSGGTAEGIFYEGSLAFSSFCEFLKNNLTVWFLFLFFVFLEIHSSQCYSPRI